MKLAPPPDIVNRKEEYEVEEIKKHRKKCQAQFTPGVKVCKVDLEMCRLVE